MSVWLPLAFLRTVELSMRMWECALICWPSEQTSMMSPGGPPFESIGAAPPAEEERLAVRAEDMPVLVGGR